MSGKNFVHAWDESESVHFAVEGTFLLGVASIIQAKNFKFIELLLWILFYTFLSILTHI